MSSADINTPCAAYNAMAARWELLHDLRGGTEAMRAKGTRWLPKETAEELKDYDVRLNRTFLYNGLERAITNIVSRPFGEPVKVDEEGLPEELVPIIASTDREGTDTTQLARCLLDDLVTHGLTHLFVDMPPRPEAATLLTIEERMLRPYFRHVAADRLIGWKWEMDAGRRVLSEIRMRECVTEPSGEFGETQIEQVRRVTKSTWEVWRKTGQTWAIHEHGKHTFGAVPLITRYAKPGGFMTATPPLEEIAETNLEHWQNSSDHANLLRFASCGILFISGTGTEDEAKPVVVGAGAVYKASAPQANMKWVEHSGAAIGAGRQRLLDLEARMSMLSMEPITARSGDVTATERAIEEGKAQSVIHQWIRGLETMLEEAFHMAARWRRITIPAGWAGVDIFDEFGLAYGAQEDLRLLSEMRAKRQITGPTHLRESKRRGLLSEDLDIAAELSALEAEGPDPEVLAAATAIAARRHAAEVDHAEPPRAGAAAEET